MSKCYPIYSITPSKDGDVRRVVEIFDTLEDVETVFNTLEKVNYNFNL